MQRVIRIAQGSAFFLLVFGLLAYMVFTGTRAFAKGDGDFIGEAIRNDMTQIAFARLAEERASNGAVRGLASAVVAGRTKDKKEASQLAESLRAHVPIASPEDSNYELRKLSGLSGPAFDKEYVGYTIADHKRRIDRYETQSKDKSAATATFAQKSLPALRDHLRRAQALSQSL